MHPADAVSAGRTPQPLIFLPKPLQFFQFIYTHSTVLLASAVIGLFDKPNLSDCNQTGHALPHQNFNLS